MDRTDRPRARRRTLPALAGAVAALLATSAACAGEPAPGSATGTPAGSATPSATTTAFPVEIPGSVLGRATRWVLDALAEQEGPSEAEAAEVFAPVFLEAVPAPDVAGVFDQLRALGPFTVVGYGEAGVTARTTVTGPGDTRYVISVSTDDADLIQGLFLQPVSDPPQVTDVQDAVDAVGDAASDSSFLLATISGEGPATECVPVAELEAGVLRPAGSAFKLYVLGAVVDAVAAGDASWDDTLTLTDDLRSLPTGTLQDEPAGTTVTVREAADAMIAISDNTATDLLIDAIGRGAVEDAVVAMGHSRPEVLAPFFTTRDVFRLAFVSQDARRAWTEATGPDPLTLDPRASERQRAVVAALPGGEIVLDQTLAARPAWPEGLDWFVSAQDLCRAHVALQERAATEAGEPVRDILSRNPGLAEPAGIDYVAFKGGSTPGAITGSWYVEDSGQRYVLVVQTASVDAPVPDGAWLVSLADQTLDVVTG